MSNSNTILLLAGCTPSGVHTLQEVKTTAAAPTNVGGRKFGNFLRHHIGDLNTLVGSTLTAHEAPERGTVEHDEWTRQQYDHQADDPAEMRKDAFHLGLDVVANAPGPWSSVANGLELGQDIADHMSVEAHQGMHNDDARPPRTNHLSVTGNPHKLLSRTETPAEQKLISLRQEEKKSEQKRMLHGPTFVTMKDLKREDAATAPPSSNTMDRDSSKITRNPAGEGYSAGLYNTCFGAFCKS